MAKGRVVLLGAEFKIFNLEFLRFGQTMGYVEYQLSRKKKEVADLTRTNIYMC